MQNLRVLYGFTAASEEFDLPHTEAEPTAEEYVIPNEVGPVGLSDTFTELPANDTPDQQEDSPADILTIQVSREKLPDQVVTNLRKIVTSKAGLIKKALGVDELTVTETDTVVSS